MNLDGELAKIDLGDVVVKIQSFNSVLEKHGYKYNKRGGVKPWSIRHSNGTCHIDTRASEWTAYYGSHEVATGTTSEELDEYFNNPR
jgi:hypothetical protein